LVNILKDLLILDSKDKKKQKSQATT